MRKLGLCVVALSACLLIACGKKDEVATHAASSASVAASVSVGGQPDFGGITKVSREVEAVGSTQELAVLAALQMAVSQVNGVRVASQMQSVRAGLDLSIDGQGVGSARAEAFAQKLIAASQGAVVGFEILSQEEIDKLDEEATARVRASDGGYSYSGAGLTGAEVNRGASTYEADAKYKKMRSYWKVRVKVDVAQYRAPDEQGRPKIVVALPRTLTGNYPVGDAAVPADEVAQAVRGRLSDILTQTKRFIVLDREFGSEMQAEIDYINGGNVRVQDAAKLGQQLAADLILIPTIEQFEYPRRAQKLRMSNRELVSYSGRGRITLRLLNAATGEVVMSDSFEHKLADADPSTMPRVVDGKSMVSQMLESLSSQIGGAIVAEIFPVSVVTLTGDQVVLSQGGESLKEGQRWQAVILGDELTDPQTGRSLGRNEVPIGVVRIDRVATKTSHGTFEDGAPSLGQPFKPGGIELRKQVSTKPESVGKGGASPSKEAAPKAASRAPISEGTAEPRPVHQDKGAVDENW